MRKITILLLSCMLPQSILYAKKKSKRPNIIFIMSDDHTSQAIGAYNSRLAPLNPTPTIDRIGNEGVIFENAFCTNSICTPSRACIMTGQYSQTNGVLDLSQPLAPEKLYLATEMKTLGYQTAIVGKWHLHKRPETFDYYNVFYGQGKYYDPILVEKGMTSMVPRKAAGAHKEKGKEVPGKRYKGHSSDVVTDITLDWLKNKRDKSKPFFLMHHFKAPHDMFVFNRKYENYLEDTYIPEPASMYYDGNHGSIATRGLNDQMKDSIGSSVGKRNSIRNMGKHMKIDPNLSDMEYKHAAYQEYLKRYLRCVKGVDDNVKRLFDYLEQNNLMDNTIIIYTGDQGFWLGEHDYIDKRWMYEESMRMPFLVRYPKTIRAGSRSDAIINNTDFAPTIIELAGGKKPKQMQGESFAEIITKGKEPKNWKQETYYRYWAHMMHHQNPGHFGIRTKEYKLIFFYGLHFKDAAMKSKRVWQTTPGWELYDLKKDPQEMNNCYNDPRYSKVVKDLKSRLHQLRVDLNETDENYPKIDKIIEENWN
ncbi:sulfatase [Halosquirtibacter xylanolyticus]|uniref:sulfatase family protein n=1 Tax=Halosquirtibacter xylanolyticus TaxID=3374599 RepID=UPI0037498E85|nr:sulfatase [Prolixibacteraceae bacterium]